MSLQVCENESSSQADQSGPHHVLFVREPFHYKPPTQAYVSQMISSVEALIQLFCVRLSPMTCLTSAQRRFGVNKHYIVLLR
jgi:hypothetical protein